MIFIISNINIGDVEEVYPINKVILCVFICLISFYGQIITKPFITDDLNQVNWNSNVTMILTLLFALFSAICEDIAMKIVFMVFLTSLNCYLIFIIGKSCLTLKLLDTKNSKFLNFINKIFQKIFQKSEFILFKTHFNIKLDFYHVEKSLLSIQNSLKKTEKKEKETSNSNTPQIEMKKINFSNIYESNNLSNSKRQKETSWQDSSISATQRKLIKLENENENEEEKNDFQEEISLLKRENHKINNLIKQYEIKIQELEHENQNLKILALLRKNELLKMYGKINQYDEIQNESFDKEDRLSKQMEPIKAHNFKNYFNEKDELAKKNSIKDGEITRTVEDMKNTPKIIWDLKENQILIETSHLKILFKKRQDEFFELNEYFIIEQQFINQTNEKIVLDFFEIAPSESIHIYFFKIFNTLKDLIIFSLEKNPWENLFALNPFQESKVSTYFFKHLHFSDKESPYFLSLNFIYK